VYNLVSNFIIIITTVVLFSTPSTLPTQERSQPSTSCSLSATNRARQPKCCFVETALSIVSSKRRGRVRQPNDLM